MRAAAQIWYDRGDTMFIIWVRVEFCGMCKLTIRVGQDVPSQKGYGHALEVQFIELGWSRTDSEFSPRRLCLGKVRYFVRGRVMSSLGNF